MNLLQAFLDWLRGTPSCPTGQSYGHRLYQVVYQAWSGGFTVSSDVARRESVYVAIAASLCLITTKEADGSYGRTWYVTQAGIGFIESYWENL